MNTKLFYGKILKDIDPKHRGYYKVHFYSAEYFLEETEGIWCRNGVHSWRNTPDSEGGEYGQYFPLHPGTKVLIRFLEEDFNTGEIVRIVSDEEPVKKFPLSKKPADRDQITQIYRTIKYENIFVINEDTTGQVKDSIHIYYHKKQTKIVIDQNGIHIFTKNNQNISIEGNSNTYIKGNLKLQVDGNSDILTKGKMTIQAIGDLNLEGRTVNINSGNSAVNNKGYDTFSDKELKIEKN